jgi:hypothetical protein
VSLYRNLVGLVFRRPRTLPRLLRAAWVFRSRGWYSRFPFLPLPSRAYLRWRMETAYGDPDHEPTADEVLRYLRWAADMRRAMHGRTGA